MSNSITSKELELVDARKYGGTFRVDRNESIVRLLITDVQGKRETQLDLSRRARDLTVEEVMYQTLLMLAHERGYIADSIPVEGLTPLEVRAGSAQFVHASLSGTVERPSKKDHAQRRLGGDVRVMTHQRNMTYQENPDEDLFKHEEEIEGDPGTIALIKAYRAVGKSDITVPSDPTEAWNLRYYEVLNLLSNVSVSEGVEFDPYVTEVSSGANDISAYRITPDGKTEFLFKPDKEKVADKRQAFEHLMYRFGEENNPQGITEVYLAVNALFGFYSNIGVSHETEIVVEQDPIRDPAWLAALLFGLVNDERVTPEMRQSFLDTYERAKSEGKEANLRGWTPKDGLSIQQIWSVTGGFMVDQVHNVESHVRSVNKVPATDPAFRATMEKVRRTIQGQAEDVKELERVFKWFLSQLKNGKQVLGLNQTIMEKAGRINQRSKAKFGELPLIGGKWYRVENVHQPTPGLWHSLEQELLRRTGARQ